MDRFIVDTSALVAISKLEPGWQSLRGAIAARGSMIPAPVLVEYERVTSLKDNVPDPRAQGVLALLGELGAEVLSFSRADASAASAANVRYGSGNGDGGLLNMLDLMVYGVARGLGVPILCTGNDFASTDALLHPASRIG